ncbi:hypothetical protein HNY73_014028 [Argiope bruennichi]|uniref:Uncharacterized protein n=1 Tax=Argiope bruennichi TaxID=94029 RepID=A0A8T0EMZ9_ARGBR|nr:hypothetical protein HNY73_014028 [Argiope bruennichi]
MTVNPNEYDKYKKCWAYATCSSDGPESEEMENCFKKLKPEEVKSAYQFVNNNYFNYKSDDIPGAIKEFCSYDDATKREASNKTLNGMLDFEKKICENSDMAGECSRCKEYFDCFFSHLNQYHQQKKC